MWQGSRFLRLVGNLSIFSKQTNQNKKITKNTKSKTNKQTNKPTSQTTQQPNINTNNHTRDKKGTMPVQL